MNLRSTALATSIALSALVGCDSQSSSAPGSGSTLTGVVAGRAALAGASVKVLDVDSNLVWTGSTNDSGRFEAHIADSVKFPVEVVADLDTLELKTLAPWEDGRRIVSNVNPVTDFAFDKLESGHHLHSIHTRSQWLQSGDSAFAEVADSLVNFEDFAVDPSFGSSHHQDSLLAKLARASDQARNDGDSTEVKGIEDVVSQLSCRFESETSGKDSLEVKSAHDSLETSTPDTLHTH
jgi:hypothetical protein